MKKILFLIISFFLVFLIAAQNSNQAFKAVNGELPANIKSKAQRNVGQLRPVPQIQNILPTKGNKLETDTTLQLMVSALQEVRRHNIKDKDLSLRTPDLSLSLRKKDSITIARPHLKELQIYEYVCSYNKENVEANSLLTSKTLEKPKFGKHIVFGSTTNPRIIMRYITKDSYVDYYHCHTLNLDDKKVALYSNNRKFAAQFLSREPTEEELDRELLFPLKMQFDTSSFFIYYEVGGNLYYDYYKVVFPQPTQCDK